MRTTPFSEVIGRDSDMCLVKVHLISSLYLSFGKCEYVLLYFLESYLINIILDYIIF